MSDTDYVNINFNAKREQITEIVELFKTDADSVLSVGDELHGFGDLYIKNRYKEHFPGLRDATKGQMDTVVQLVKIINKHNRMQCPDLYSLDDRGHRTLDYDVLLDCLMRNYTFKTLRDTEQVLVFEDGVYRSGATVIKEFVESVLGSSAETRIVREVIAHVQRKTYTRRELFNTDTRNIPVRNGLLNLDTFELDSFDPHKLFTYRLPVEYDPAADYSATEKFFEEVLHKADIPVMQEVFGYALHAAYPAHKLFWWLGVGRNGKTTTGNLLTALIGFENTAGVPLKQLDGGHRFAVARLFGKLLNVVAEPETKSVLQTPTLKSAVGDDLIYGEKKNVQDAFPFVNFAKFVVYANEVPRIEDVSFAFWERVVAIEFPHTFTGEKAKKRHHEEIIKKDGLAGLLNWALVGLKRLKENDWEFTETDAQTITKIDMKRKSQPVASFIEDWTEFDNTAEIAKEVLFNLFKVYCNVYGLLVPLEGEFTRDLKRSAGVRLTRPRINHKQVSHWQGRKIKDTLEVAITFLDGEKITADKITEENKADIKIKTRPLAKYMNELSELSEYTFLYTSILRQKTVIIENKDILALIEKFENSPTHATQCTHCEKMFKSDTLQRFGNLCVCPTCFAALTTEIEQVALEKDEDKNVVEYSCPCGEVFHDITDYTNHKAICPKYKKEIDKTRAEKKRVKNVIVSEPITKNEEWRLTYLKKTYDITPKRKPGVFVCEECGERETIIYYIPGRKYPASCLDCLEKALSERDANVF